jgi:hypothetical protein
MRNLKFRVYDKQEKRFLAAGFALIGEVMMSGMLFDRPLERLNDLVINQWTGLKDFTGVDLYEGDTVRMRGDFEEDWKRFEGWHIETREADSYISLVSTDGKDSIPLFFFDYRGRPEVIGCIYELEAATISSSTTTEVRE